MLLPSTTVDKTSHRQVWFKGWEIPASWWEGLQSNVCDSVGHKTRNSGPNILKAFHISFSLRDPQTRYQNTHLIEIKNKVQRCWGIYWGVERFTKQLVAGLAFKCRFIWLENPHWYLRYTFWRSIMRDDFISTERCKKDKSLYPHIYFSVQFSRSVMSVL